MKSVKEKIIEVLKATNRDGIDRLINEMENGGFFTAPCSGSFHLCCEGGLAEHSWIVMMTLDKLAEELMDPEEYIDCRNSIRIVALLHDLGKMGDHGKPNYIPNILKSGKISEAKPYEQNKDLTYEEHEIRSVIIASRFIELTEDEETAILHHNGLFGKLDSSYGNANFCKTKLAFLLHTADMYCSRFVEV